MENGGNGLGAGPPQGKIPDDAIRAQLARTLRSRLFTQAPRCGAFLGSAIEEKLAGRSYEICTESIRQHLYPKARGHDPEACVGAAAGRLRNILDGYYKAGGLTGRTAHSS